MKRVFIMVLDSLGIGGAKDAKSFGDQGANTLVHIVQNCFKVDNKQNRSLKIPNLISLGLGRAAQLSTGYLNSDLESSKMFAAYGCAGEISSGKDTPSGHWEIAGVPVLFEWHYFKDLKNSFPDKLLSSIVQDAKIPGYLGNCHASGTEILNRMGQEHIETKKPIFYTSKDSVFQILAHEKIYGLKQLYNLCSVVRKKLDNEGYKVGRVIARPFTGTNPQNFIRTGNRKDFAIPPHSKTVLQKVVQELSGEVVAIGKVSDIYNATGITKKVKGHGLDELFDATIKEMKKLPNNSMVFTNFVDFDSVWGHRRDVDGYAEGLELFDQRLPEILQLVQDEDMLIITADHGCDPTWTGTDHTRENVPVLIYGPKIKPGCLGFRKTFSDIAQTICSFFKLTPMQYGQNMLLERQGLFLPKK